MNTGINNTKQKKRVIVIGATGHIGQAAMTDLDDHDVIMASRSGGSDPKHLRVDVTRSGSLASLFESVIENHGSFDAVISAVGHCEYADFESMTNDQWASTIQSKLVGQMNVVREGLKYIDDRGSFTLISGILNIKPMPMGIADATTSGAIDTFVKCVAHELPRGIRINAVNPTVIESAWADYRDMMPGYQPVADKLVGKAFRRCVDSFITGQVIFVDA
ncbi:short chain dehydrogenase [Pandoraea captiosa]|uniref:Short chain dehydrogenase n=1 Tax=Pandoraea captiosa TaxID=2508302 RepID=A0A5E5ADN6_9BURK|nr:short chain dehydrogenase [Pandoraea captiosa]VVE71216.1 short chain dehydrogenase [Pandoraea captiosa]